MNWNLFLKSTGALEQADKYTCRQIDFLPGFPLVMYWWLRIPQCASRCNCVSRSADINVNQPYLRQIHYAKLQTVFNICCMYNIPYFFTKLHVGVIFLNLSIKVSNWLPIFHDFNYGVPWISEYRILFHNSPSKGQSLPIVTERINKWRNMQYISTYIKFERRTVEYLIPFFVQLTHTDSFSTVCFLFNSVLNT